MTALEVYQPGSIGESIVVFGNLAAQIAKTDFVPQEFRGRPEAVLACMMYGQELGLGPMQSLNLTQSIKGRVGLKPEGMRALVLAAGHKVWTDEFTDTRVVLCGQRHGEDEVERVDWDLARAKQAGLGTGDNWKKYPRAMLLARATSELCRLKFADIVGGLSYTPDELEEFEPIVAQPTESRRRAAPAARELEPVRASGRSGDDPQASVVGASPEPAQPQHVAHSRPPAMAEVVDTAPVPEQAPSTGTRRRKPPTAAGPMSGRAPEARPADAKTVADVTDVIDALKELGDVHADAGRAAWKSAGIPVKSAGHLSQAEAEQAFEVLSAVYREALTTQPTLDGSDAA